VASCAAVTAPQTPAGWYPDPTASHRQRYWDGSSWTDHVAGIEAPEASSTPSNVPALLLVLLAGAAVSLFFGAYGRIHDPTGEATLTLFFTSTINLKVWFATVAILFALVQIVTALRLFGKIKIPRRMPSWLGDAHRLSGTLAFLFTLPVAFHCLWSLGFASDTSDPRTYIHSVVGCAFYGLFVVKVLSVRIHELPGWLLPSAGFATFASLAVLWVTSSLWFFQNVSFPGI
jgi:hypothetical protein